MPLIPVSGTEAQVFALRPGNFPFLSIVSTRHETSTVLTNGIGQHQLIGMTLDTSAAQAVNEFAKELFLTLIMAERN